jgi:hypothetical protein
MDQLPFSYFTLAYRLCYGKGHPAIPLLWGSLAGADGIACLEARDPVTPPEVAAGVAKLVNADDLESPSW